MRLGPLLATATAFALLAGTAGATHDRVTPAQLVRAFVQTRADLDRLANAGLDLSEHGEEGYIL